MLAVRFVPAALVLLLVIGGCRAKAEGAASVGSPPISPPPSSERPVTPPSAQPPVVTPTPRPPDLASAQVRLTLIATVEEPTAMAVRPGDSALYLAERAGRVRAVRDGWADPQPVLDIADLVSTNSERGLLGLAFAPDGTRLYLSYTAVDGALTLAEYPAGPAGVDPSAARVVLAVDHPHGQHNGGNIAFGPDGFLYWGLGDGGSDEAMRTNAQSPETLLGKLVRVGPGGQPEIWASGLRNPWRFSFDALTGDLWLTDVGDHSAEEINFALAQAGAGANYGWAGLEGSTPTGDAPVPSDAVPPLWVYPHDDRCAVTGGFVYRGSAIPDLAGAYVYGDVCDRRIRALRQEDGLVTAERDLGVVADGSLVSFGQDLAGELYALSQDGYVLRLDPAP